MSSITFNLLCVWFALLVVWPALGAGLCGSARGVTWCSAVPHLPANRIHAQHEQEATRFESI